MYMAEAPAEKAANLILDTFNPERHSQVLKFSGIPASSLYPNSS